MNFEQALIRKQQLEQAVAQASGAMQHYRAARQANGLLPDELRESFNYKVLKDAYQEAFDALRSFNVHFLKEYRQHLSAKRVAQTVENDHE